MGAGRRKPRTAGYILLENVIAIAIMTTVGLSLLAMLQQSMRAVVKAREQTSCGRALQTGFSRLKNIDFYALFASDSSSANHGLWAAYPYKAALDGYGTTLSAARFDRFKVLVTFMRRDSSDSNADGLTSDLVAFTDLNSDRIDDYDPAVRYLDQNLDGDFYDTYSSGGRTVAEQPDTHVKQVTLQVYRRGRLVCSQSELVSLEQLSGDINPSSEAVLTLLVSTPSNASYLYSHLPAPLAASQALAISSGMPEEPARYRSDVAQALWVVGETEPLASVEVYVGASGVLATLAADAAGAYGTQSAPVTAALVEGSNKLRLRAVKDAYLSPVTERTVLLDLQAPQVAYPAPAGTVYTYTPSVYVRVADPGVSTTTTSGICVEALSMRVNGSTVAALYDAAGGSFTWVDAAGGAPVLSSGAYVVVVEAADYAGYKSSLTWTFTVSVPDTDNSAPSVSNKSPIGVAPSSLPEISVRLQDNQSGIDPSRVTLELDGVLVVDASNVSEHFDTGTDVLTYTPAEAFADGSAHVVRVSASHWATDPADKVTATDTWIFTVP
jgi:Tfp pilus assembly protein PilV